MRPSAPENRKSKGLSAILAFGITCVSASSEAAPPATAPAPAGGPPAGGKAEVPPPEKEAAGVKYGNAALRNFYDVLEDLLADFEWDIKSGNVVGMKEISIRNIALSENIPPSFRSHLELNVTERILRHSRAKVIQCLACRARKAVVSGDEVVVSGNENNPVEMVRIAKVAGIKHFLDAAFSYTASGMVLSMSISDPDTGGVLWSRSYNSETSRASAMRRGVDYASIEQAKQDGTYPSTFQYRTALLYSFEPNVSGSTGCIGLLFRMMERYDQRRKEVGFEINFQKDASSLVASSATTAATASTNLYGSFALSALFMHAWNLFGEEENLQGARGSIFAGLGGTYASGYLGGLVRAGYEWRLARHWAFSGNVGFRPSSTFTPTTGSAATVSGLEFGLGVHYIF